MATRRRYITRANIRSGVSRAKAAFQRLERYREAARETMAQVVTAVEIGVTAFGLGWVEGRYGEIDVVGVPLDAGVAGAMHLLGFTGFLGKDMSRHAHAVGNGALAIYLGKTGLRIGTEMAQDSASGVRRSRRVPQQLGHSVVGMSAAERIRQRQGVHAY